MGPAGVAGAVGFADAPSLVAEGVVGAGGTVPAFAGVADDGSAARADETFANDAAADGEGDGEAAGALEGADDGAGEALAGAGIEAVGVLLAFSDIQTPCGLSRSAAADEGRVSV